MKNLTIITVLLVLLGGCTSSVAYNRDFWFANDALTDITVVNNTSCALYVFDSRTRVNRHVVGPHGSTLVTYRLSAYRSHTRNRREVTVVTEVYADDLVATIVKKFRLNNRPGKKDYILEIGGRKLGKKCQ